ncbi:hypothetical protein BDY24DRAFT_413101 [Mrakia frigida]|uniref:uncharacterized protein n=1 Tax=Mrakia frigida TaxID=29902 RepID=UPI003FCC1A9D
MPSLTKKLADVQLTLSATRADLKEAVSQLRSSEFRVASLESEIADLQTSEKGVTIEKAQKELKIRELEKELAIKVDKTEMQELVNSLELEREKYTVAMEELVSSKLINEDLLARVKFLEAEKLAYQDSTEGSTVSFSGSSLAPHLASSISRLEADLKGSDQHDASWLDDILLQLKQKKDELEFFDTKQQLLGFTRRGEAILKLCECFDAISVGEDTELVDLIPLVSAIKKQAIKIKE